MQKKLFLIIFYSLSFVHTLQAIEVPLTFSDARVSGMGNTFTAIADDKNMLFFNPAGFATFGLMEISKVDAIRNPTKWRPQYDNIGVLTIFSATFGLNSNLIDKFGINNILYYAGVNDTSDNSAPLFKILDMKFFEKYQDGTLTYAEAVEANQYFTKLYYTTLHPTFNFEILSYARHYFGFGSFISSDTVLQIEPAGFFPLVNVKAKMHTDYILPMGIGIPIPGYKHWAAGITLKYFNRIKVEINNINDFVTVYEYMTGDYLNTDIDEIFKTKSILDIMLNGYDYTSVAIPQIKIGTGYGFDLGAMYRPKYAWKFGLLLSDVYTKINWWDKSPSTQIPINLRLGAAYMPRFSLIGILEDPILAMDMEDLFHQQRKNFFLKWHFGTEIKFLYRVINLRFGINEGYPSFGAGVDINFYFLSKIPILQWLRPNRIYFPKFNPNDREFLEKNPVCCCMTALLAPLFYSHTKIDVSYTGYELGLRPGDLMDYQLLLRVSLSYSY